MPLIFNEGRTPNCWAGRKNAHATTPAKRDGAPFNRLSIALINNMADPAMEDTELQFFELLDSAAESTPIHMSLYSLPELPRGERAQQHLQKFYSGLDTLWNEHLDGVIITGTEPRQPNLQDEPYWRSLVAILDWAEGNTTSAVLSCLAAHASVLHSDGIARNALRDKRFGVFDHKRNCDHELIHGVADPMPVPQSRWNEVREDALIASGYTILTKSVDGAPDLFVKVKKKSLFVHLQGHPEYGARTLLKEYRRDIRRFLGRERDTYPTMPQGYFDAFATKLLNTFRSSALPRPQEDFLAVFPESAVTDTLQNRWGSPAVSLYRNWLKFLKSKKTTGFTAPAMARVSHD